MNIYQAKDFSKLLVLIGTCPRRGRVGVYAHLARKMKLKSPRTAAMVVKKQRAPSAGLVKTVIELLRCTAVEQEYVLLLAEKSRRLVKGLSVTEIDGRIERFQKMQTIQVGDSITIGGVRIEMTAETSDHVRKRISECLKALLVDLESEQGS